MSASGEHVIRVVCALIGFLAIHWTSVSHAGDGVTEINQPIVDSIGFPYVIADPGSYRLTGNIDASAAGSAAVISIAAGVKDVTLDLGGFAISVLWKASEVMEFQGEPAVGRDAGGSPRQHHEPLGLRPGLAGCEALAERGAAAQLLLLHDGF